MPKLTIGLAIFLLIIGNFAGVISDAFIKEVPGDASVLQFIFFRQITAVLLLAPFCFLHRSQPFFGQLKWHFVRAHIWLIGAICMVLSLSALPLATVNALFYTSPIIMLSLMMFFSSDTVKRSSLLVVILGFVGVLIIVKPSQFNWAAVMALIVAVSMALNNLLIKKLPTHHSVFQTLFLTSLMGIPSSLLLALGEGSKWDFSSLWLAAASNIFILCYAGICVWVYRAINPSKVAGAEYTGLLGAIIVGSLWFNETPEMSMYYGAALIILPLIWVARADRKTAKLATKLKETT